jgi:Xaa-Pro aminopeptidase
VLTLTDPTVLPKACKNPVEQAGHRAAQPRWRGGQRFLHWLSVAAPKGGETELRRRAPPGRAEKTGLLKDLSFDTISGAGPNAAIPHYRVDEQSNRAIEPNSVYLVDSGGQYRDGTTDITRTVWVGPDAAPAEVKDRFTRVLKGHIALDQAVFPLGTPGSARQLCPPVPVGGGLDYAHGTGHGVGSFLAVHEGPQRIAKASGAQAGTGQGCCPA